jgi:carbonic anhydrase
MKRERKSTLICALAARMIAPGSGASSGSNEHGHRGAHWGYETANGPQAWGGMSSEFFDETPSVTIR